MSVRTAARLPTSWWAFFDNGQTAGMPGVAMKKCVQGRPLDLPLEGKMSAKPTEGGVRSRVASGWITPLCPAGHLPLKGGDWLHRRPTRSRHPELERGAEGRSPRRRGGGCELA